MYDFSYFPTLETERLRLRSLSESDATAVLEEFSHPEVMRHLDPEPPVTDIESAMKLLHWLMSMYDDKAGLRWAIELKATGDMIGTCGFHRWKPQHQRAEIGYDLQYAHWSKGYATEVVREMLKFGFNEMALHRIEADCNEGNIGSMRVLEKAGFTCEGLWRERIWERGEWVSLKQYAILKREYRG